MKFKITKEEFNALPDILKAEYEEKGESYFQKVPDKDEAIGEIGRAKDNESNAHKETKKQLKDLQDKLNANKDDDNRRTGNVEALEKSWSEKFNARETELNSELNKYKSTLISSTKDSILTNLAAKIAKPDSSRLFKKGIEDRIAVEFVNDSVNYRILDLQGKPSAMTLEDFEKEIIANKEFASILVGNKGVGTGSNDSSRLRIGDPAHNNEKSVDLSVLSPSEFAARITANKSKED